MVVTLCQFGNNCTNPATLRMVFYKTDWERVPEHFPGATPETGIITGVPGCIPVTDEINNEYLTCLDCAVGYRCAYPTGDCFDLTTGELIDLWEIIEQELREIDETK